VEVTLFSADAGRQAASVQTQTPARQQQ